MTQTGHIKNYTFDILRIFRHELDCANIDATISVPLTQLL